MIVIRSYKLKIIEPNKVKLDTARYTYNRFLMYVNQWVGHLYFNGNKFFSTKGMGMLAHDAQYKAHGIISAQTASKKVTGNKTNVPEVESIGCPAKIESSNNSFDYWVKVSNQWTKAKTVELPVNSHRSLNKALKEGWSLNPVCELVKEKSNHWFIRVFVQKEVKRAVPRNKSIGVDVGYKNGVARSDNYIGKNTSKAIKKFIYKNAERRRQGHLSKVTRTYVKQILDREARLIVARCKDKSSNLVIESPKRLGYLCRNNLQGWASAYFGNRCRTLCSESEVFCWEVNPAYTSQTCSSCGTRDSRSRVKQTFKCVSCGNTDHADVNAAKVIALKGTLSIERYVKVAK